MNYSRPKLITISYLVLPTGDTEMTELTEGVGDVGLEDAEDEADNGRIYNKHITVEKSEKPYHCDNCYMEVVINYACTNKTSFTYCLPGPE